MDHDDYETLPVTSVAKNMMAGATAGVLEHCIMYPMDSVKTRMQSLSPITAGQTIVSTYRNMVLKEGWRRPIRGMGAVVAGAGPAHALYFATYEYSKDVTLKMFPHHQQLSFVSSAVTATLIHDAISNPTEVIKQRLQMYNSPYKSIVQCARGVYQSEGVRAFYRSYTTQLIMNLPYQTIHFTTYEFIQNMLNHDHKYNPPVHMVAGALAGGAASAFTTPLDVVKTLLNTQETGIGLTKGMREAVNQIYTMAGPRGFFKGLYARVLYAMPATAICWSTYEFAKFILSQQSREDYHSSPSTTTTTAAAKSPGGAIAAASSGPIGGGHLSPKDVLASAADKVRLDDTIRLGYVLPSTRASGRDADDAADEAAERKSAAAASNSNSSQSTSNSNSNSNNNSNGSLLPRELPSMSGAGVYSSALSLNTMHTTDATARPSLGFTEARGCNS